MPIKLSDIERKNQEYLKNNYVDIGGLKWNKASYNNLSQRLRDLKEQEDIAIKKKIEEEKRKEKNEGLVKSSSAFDDGYHFGDITKTIFSTGGDLLADIGEGFVGTLEGITDWATYRVSDAIDFFGNDELANDFRKNADFNSTEALFGKNEIINSEFGNWREAIDENSIIGNTGDQIFEGVGNVAGLAATTAVGGNTKLVSVLSSYTSAYGNARSEAKRNGASDDEANKVGIINGFAETLSEQFFQGMPGLKSAGWGEKLNGKIANKVTKFFGTNAGKVTLKTLDALGEGSEEMLSNSFVSIGNDIVHYFDSNFNYGMDNQTGNILEDALNSFFSEESRDSFFSAAIVSGLLGAGKSIIDVKTQNKIINSYAKDNKMSFKDAKYILTGENLENSKNEIIRDNLDYNSQVELEDMAKKRILNYMKSYNGTNVEAQIEQQIKKEEESLGENFSEIEKNNLKNKIRSELEDRINSSERYREFTLKDEPVEEREKGLYESFKKNNRNDTKTTHEVYNLLKTLQDNNETSNYRITSNEELVKMGELQKIEQNGKVKYLKDGKEIIINGFKKGNTIYINADGINPYQATIGHEIGEAIKSSDKMAYENLKQIVKQVYGEGNLDDYKQLYGENLTDNIEDEYVNDKLGEMFKDNKLIDRIADNRNLFQKIIYEVKRLTKYVTSSKEQKQLQRLQKSLEDKYVQLYKDVNFNTQNDNSSYSIIGEKGFRNLKDYVSRGNSIDEKTRLLINKLDTSLMVAKLNYNRGFDRTEIFNNTYWYNDNGKWKVELSNSDLEMNLPGKIKVGEELNLGKIIGNDLLTIAYPELNETTYIVKNFDKKGFSKTVAKFRGKEFKNTTKLGYFSPKENSIIVNKNIISDSIITKKNLVHEIQHIIQGIEDFEKGSTTKLGKLNYFNKNGEAEARVVSDRIDLTQNEINSSKILPFYEEQEINKQNKINSYLNSKRGIIDKIRDAIYTKFGDELNNGKSEKLELDRKENYSSNYKMDIQESGRERSRINTSFSLGQNGETQYISQPNENAENTLRENNRNTNIKEYQETPFSLSSKKSEQNNSNLFETKILQNTSDYLDSLKNKKNDNSKATLSQNNEDNLPIYEEEYYGILTKEDYKNKSKELVDNYIDKSATKISEQVKEIAKRNLELNKKNIAELRSLVSNYTNMTREDIYNSDAKEKIIEFVKKHSQQQYAVEISNQELRDLQKDIRSREFIISSDYKGEFPDGITNFKKNNPGINIKFGKIGNLDTQLQELSNIYPGLVESDVPYGDIPFVLSNVLKQESKTRKLESYKLTDNEIESISNKMFYGLTNNALTDNDLQKYVISINDKIRNKMSRQMAIKEYRQLAKDMIGDISQIKDKKRGMFYQVNTMKRNLRDIMNQEQAKKMYDTYFKPIHIHNAQIESDINDYNQRIKQFKLNNEESVYTQMLGELKYNPKTSLREFAVNEYFNKNKSKIDETKVNSAIEEFRNIYDELIDRINESLEANGYKPIDYRKGYFPHFNEDKAQSILGKFAERLGWNIKKEQLPTDIAGITDEFSPGKVWTSFSQKRTGDATDYNALKGMDNYLRGAMDVIYHTQDIQKLRALEGEIRYQYSEKGVQEKFDEIYNNQELTNDEKYSQAALVTDNVKNNPLGNFATELRNYTNSLANKKSISDRGMEQTLGRDMYSVMNNISGRVSANMVGANISSAMTNFIPITQAWSQVSTKNMLKGIYTTIKASIKDDGFTKNSVYLTNRTNQADRLYKTSIDKVNQKLSIPFEAIDSFTSNTIVRSKYYENLDHGMSEIEAIDNADEFAKDIMAGRSKGDSPTIFNKKNPIAKLFTAFQLEVNNQYGYMFKDLKVDIGKEAKAKLASAFMKMFLGAWIYNIISEKVTGRKSAFSPIDIAIEDSKVLTNDDLDLSSKIEKIATNTAQEIPFLGGVLGGGRLPIQSAIPYDDPLSMILSTGENVGNLFDNEKRDKAIKSLTKEWSKPVYYLALPFAGGQIKKTKEGLDMYNENLPLAGSYTDSGKLRFEADTSPLGMLQSAVFGQYASENAREYFEKGYSPLSEKQVSEALSINLPINEYREINKGISSAKKEAKEKGKNQTEAMYDYVYNLPSLTNKQKNILINNKLKNSDEIKDDNGYIKYVDKDNNIYWYDKKNNMLYNKFYSKQDFEKLANLTKSSSMKDISDYGNFESLEEYNYSHSNPSKYKAITQITDFSSFKKYEYEIRKIKYEYSKDLERKKAVFEYINSLSLNQYQKLMLQKLAGGYSIRDYESQMFNYIEKLELTKQEKQDLHKELFGG